MNAAYFLKKNDFTVQVLEGNNYLGGRIKTVITDSNMALESSVGLVREASKSILYDLRK